jgi:phage baseplate assembly protein gpV
MFDPGLRLAKVVKTYPSGYAIDVVMYDDGSHLSNVQVLSPTASTSSGFNDLPAPEVTGGDWSLQNGKTRDMIAVVAFIRGAPVALGFMFPQVCQMLFEDKDRMVYRHASDAYLTIDKSGNAEFAHPSGAFVRIASSPSHEDLTGKDYDKKWKISRNTGVAAHIHIEQAGGVAKLDIAPSGAVVLDTVSTLDVTVGSTVNVTAGGAVTVTAPSVTLDTPDTTCTGNLLVSKSLTVLGTGVSGTVSSLRGTLQVTDGDVIADTVSLKTHVHSGVTSGGSTTGQPTS